MYANAYDRQQRVALKIYQGEAMYVSENLYLGEILFDIPPMAAGQVQCFVRFTYDINGVLEVEAKIPLTKEEKKLVIVNKDLDMTQEEIDEKLKEFERIKNPLTDERNTYILEWGQRLFMQCSRKEMRDEILGRMQYFQHMMNFDEHRLPQARKYLTVYFAYIEGLLNSYAGFADDMLKDGAWYQEEDEEEREMETLFREWEEEKEDNGEKYER